MNKYYAEGREARDSDKSKSACEYGVMRMEKRHQWLAGWHDRDMELGVVLTGSFKPIFAV